MRCISSIVLACLASAILAIACGSDGTRSAAVPSAKSAVKRVVAAGDIASCASGGDEATAKLVAGIEGTVVALGDEAYENGSAKDFRNCYDPTWGRFKDRTRPVPGNHEYETPGARGYFSYFGKAAGDPSEGYYSYDLGAWHVVALNSNLCLEVDGCRALSPQVRWLKADLAANEDRDCMLAYMHHPRFSSGVTHGSTSEVGPLWEVLYDAGGLTWSSPATSTTTSASRRRTRAERRTPSAASASSW